MTLFIQESAVKDLKNIDKTTATKILLQIKKLKNHYPPLRYRIGDYRVLFDVDGNTLIVVNVKHRKEAY